MEGRHNSIDSHNMDPVRTTIAILGMAFLAVSMSAVAIGCVNQVQGSGTAATDQREVPAFREVQASGSLEVQITIGSPQSVSITADDNILPILKTEVQNQRLIIRSDQSYRARAQEPLVKITVPELRGIDNSGSTRTSIGEVSSDDFNVQTSGSARVTIDRLTATTFHINTSGSADIQAAGRADHVVIGSSGSAVLRLNDLMARAVDVDSSGSARMEVQATESITGSTSGSANIVYSGSPKVAVNSSGSSKVSAR
jgi:hypothetical protein